jgi:putative hydrolase of the HAD superfamily
MSAPDHCEEAPRSYSAVLFDLGGVVLGSPLEAIRAFETDHGLPEAFVNRVVVENGPRGAWARHELGEIGFDTFCRVFEEECRMAGESVDVKQLMASIDEAARPRPLMLEAIDRLREAGLAVGALTNNWATLGRSAMPAELRARFDVFVESVTERVRKPDPEIYRRALERLGVDPPDVVFLDDLGRNLKPARAMGMATIKVDDAYRALRELGALLGVDLV